MTNLFNPIIIAALLVNVQLLLTLASSGAPWRQAYGQLFRWDGGWYKSILVDGYHSNVPPVPQDPGSANVAFFPGYPLAARLPYLLGLSAENALLVTAQLACLVFWLYVLLFLQRWKVALGARVLCIAALLAHPAAFYLVTSYSESLFLVGLLGFMYWRRHPVAWPLAAVHGFAMTATRLFGVPLAAIPLLDSRREASRGWLRAAAISGFAALGAVVFFAYCQWRFGYWNLYMLTQQVGWNIHPCYFAVLDPAIYRIVMPNFREVTFPDELSRLAVPFMALAFTAIAVIEYATWRSSQRATGWRRRLPFYVGALLLFWITISGLHCRQMISVVRYSYCIHVMLILGVTPLGNLWWRRCGRGRVLWLIAALALCAVSLWLQFALARIFTHGGWVA